MLLKSINQCQKTRHELSDIDLKNERDRRRLSLAEAQSCIEVLDKKAGSENKFPELFELYEKGSINLAELNMRVLTEVQQLTTFPRQ